MNRFFQAFISRFLREHLDDVDVHDELRLKGMFKYVIGQNQKRRRDPAIRPDFVVMRSGRVEAILDAKYRDLWAEELPPEMLYQLAVYALGRGSGQRVAAILYPTVDNVAREQTITIHEPVRGVPLATVVLRPVHLVKLERMLRAGRPALPERVELATKLAFGQLSEPTLH